MSRLNFCRFLLIMAFAVVFSFSNTLSSQFEVVQARSDHQAASDLGRQKEMISIDVVETLPDNHIIIGEMIPVVSQAVDIIEGLNLRKAGGVQAQQALDRVNKLSNKLSKILRLKQGTLVGVITIVQNANSVSVAEWEGSPSDPTIKGTILWDAPEFNLLLLEVDRAILSSPDRMKEFLANTIVAAEPPLGINRVWFKMLRNPKPAGLQGFGRVSYTNIPANALAKGYEFQLATFSTSNRAYVAFKIGKRAGGQNL